MELILAIAVCVGCVTLTRDQAIERGRSATVWLLLGIFACVVGLLLGWLSAVLLLTEKTESGVPVMLAAFMWFFAPSLGGLSMLLLVMALPESVPRVGGRRWPVHSLSVGQSEAFDGELCVVGGQVRVGQLTIAGAELREIDADGECVRLGWAEGVLLLFPLGIEREGIDSARARSKFSQGLARRLRRLLRKPATA
jgi:hypothetical protein